MKLDSLYEYLIPIIILILYFVVSKRRSQKTVSKEEEKKVLAPLAHRKAASSEHPIRRKQAELHSQIEKKKIDSVNHELLWNIKEKPASESHRHAIDPSYAHKTKGEISRAEKLLKKKSSLREALLLKEIIHRPYDF